MSFEKPVVVIDNGSYSIKAGFACDNHPVSIFRSVVGRPAYLKGSYGREYYEVRIGEDAFSSNEDLDLCNPLEKGRIVHWDNMERIWFYTFYKELKVAPEDRAVILGCTSDTTMKEKVRCCEVFFEALNAPALCIQPQSVLAMYGSGCTTGICIDMGYDKASVTPVYEGGLISYAIIDTNLNAKNINKHIKQSLEKRGLYFEKGHKFFEDMKKLVYITQNIAIDLKTYWKKYKLPDGNEVDVSHEAFMTGELFFQPDEVEEKKTEFIAIQDAILTASLKCDAELRPMLYEAIVPFGGWSTVPGLNERLELETEKVTGMPINVIGSSESYTVSWLGGATFAGMSDSVKMWVTKKQYEDYGAKIVKNKFM